MKATTRRKLLELIAHISERSYCRGQQQGVLFFQRGRITPSEAREFRFGRSQRRMVLAGLSSLQCEMIGMRDLEALLDDADLQMSKIETKLELEKARKNAKRRQA